MPRPRALAGALLALILGAATCSSPAREACEGKPCGDRCDRPGDEAPAFCSPGGACSVLVPSCGPRPCVEHADCAAWFSGRVVCQDGSVVAGAARCVAGTCLTDVSPCPCVAQLAIGLGECDAEIGWAFDGFDCRSVSGCLCAGPDCGEIFDTEEGCASFYRMCFEG